MAKKKRNKPSSKPPAEPQEPVRQDGDFAPSDDEGTRVDATQKKGFFTFSGQLEQDTYTDIFGGILEMRQETAPEPAIEVPEPEPPEPEPEAAPEEPEPFAEPDAPTQTDASFATEEVEAPDEPVIEVLLPEEAPHVPTETDLGEPNQELSYLVQESDQTVDLDQPTLTDVLKDELHETAGEIAQDDDTASTPDLRMIREEEPAAPDADETASVPDVRAFREAEAGDPTASLPDVPRFESRKQVPLVPITETKPDPELEEGEAPFLERAREPAPKREPRHRRERRPRRVRERRTGPSFLDRVARGIVRLVPRPGKLRLGAMVKALGAGLKEGLVGTVSAARPKRAELKINRTAEWWRRTLVEIAALFAIVVPVEVVVSGGALGSFGVHPHPYWLIVLPMAGARGVVAGLLAASMASVLYTIGAAQAIRPEHFGDLFTYKTMIEPILFYGVGFFAGELHDELALRHQKLERLLSDVQERNTRLRQERDVLADANRELERRIVDHSVQFGNLIEAATRIENAGRTEVFEVALDLVEEHCGAFASILLVLEDASIDYLTHRGWPDDELSDRLAAARGSPFVERAIAEGINVNGFQPGETAPESGPLVVAPLFDASGVVKALLCLDEIPPMRLNESSITLFLGIADWISASLSRLARGEDVQDPRTASIDAGPEADIWLGSVDDLGERLRLELERCSRYGVPTAFLAIQAAEWKDTSSEGVDAVDRYVLTHFTGGMRPSDSLYRFGYPACYLLVLAGTTVEGAEVVKTRLMRRLDYSPRREVGKIEIFATGPDADAPDLASLAGRVAGRFRDTSPLPLEGRCPVELPTESKVGGIDTFLRRIKIEASLAFRNGFDLHVVGVSADGASPDIPATLARHLRQAGDQVLRPTDGVYSIGPHHCAIVMPCTGDEDAAMVAHRLVTTVRERDPDAAYGDLETQVLGLGPTHPDAMAFLEALARRERGAR